MYFVLIIRIRTIIFPVNGLVMSGLFPEVVLLFRLGPVEKRAQGQHRTRQ